MRLKMDLKASRRPYFAFIFLLFGSILALSDSLKILVVETNFCYSHLRFGANLADKLVDGGHTVHFVVFKWNSPLLPPVPTRAQRFIEYEFPKNKLKDMDAIIRKLFVFRNPFDGKTEGLSGLVSALSDLSGIKEFNTQCSMLLNDADFFESLSGEQYDVAVWEVIDMCSGALFHLLNIPTRILVSPLPLMPIIARSLGVPRPLYVPNMNHAPLQTDRMTFTQRLYNVAYTFIDSPLVGDDLHQKLEMINNSRFKHFPDWKQLTLRSSYVFVNTFEMLEFPAPISAKIKHIGGIALQAPTPLKPDIEKIFLRAKSGVILFSFGSVVETKMIPESVWTAILNSFVRFSDYEVIIRTSGNVEQLRSEIARKYPNIHLFAWVDQISVLAHPKTKMFVTHCGLNSLNEAAYYGVPMVAIPMFGDQTFNSAIVYRRRIGIVLRKDELDERTLTEAFEKILSGKEHSRNALVVGRKLRDFPENPTEVFVKSVEYAAQFGGDLSELNLDGAGMDFFHYFGLDIISFIVSIAFTIIFLLYFTIRQLHRSIMQFYNVLRKQKML